MLFFGHASMELLALVKCDPWQVKQGHCNRGASIISWQSPSFSFRHVSC
ncbi:hypothetical protein F383_10221 [Gossypium arboreum]|uniref:Uncharacterized protein n=1 Tax=Gossypium arboreum TaxID=29729 RepID=A0A0B0MN65_GOSAR|nr:hypothetical protein F383_06435 [Gossypium arboreum]KHG25963.1 hypothetical protein F383_10221 [Gossypium arboreum]